MFGIFMMANGKFLWIISTDGGRDAPKCKILLNI